MKMTFKTLMLQPYEVPREWQLRTQTGQAAECPRSVDNTQGRGQVRKWTKHNASQVSHYPREGLETWKGAASRHAGVGPELKVPV